MNRVDSIAKIPLGCYPTPLHELPNMSRAMGDGKRLYLKRGDLCGIGFGGNKIRKREYLLGDAIRQKCDCMVTGGGSLSNQPIAAAACANQVGLPAYLILPKTANIISRRLAEQMGASIIISENEPSNSVAKLIRQTAKVLREQGHNPYIIPPGASSVHGVLGYTDAMKEMYEQAANMGVSIDHIVCCGGTGNTYVGVVLGNKNNSAVKCYMADTGLLVSHTFNENEIMDQQLYRQIMNGRLSLNEGMLYENVISQMISAKGRKLYFYTRYSEEKHRNDIEIDFLLSNKSKTNFRVFPIEVKSSKNYTATSLGRFKESFGKKISGQYIIHPKNLSMEHEIIKIPPYMFCTAFQ